MIIKNYNKEMIRKACDKDIDGLNNLLIQVRETHTALRSDLFMSGTKKYTDDELKSIIGNEETPIFVFEQNGKIVGHAFCIIESYESEIWVKHKTLYIDDICVDEKERGKGIASALVEYVKNYAKQISCYNITLNVWTGNTDAEKLYTKMGFKTYKTGMEIIL